jgi:hypothetical protein
MGSKIGNKKGGVVPVQSMKKCGEWRFGSIRS